MIKRLQVSLSNEAWHAVEAITTEASENFDVGTINYSDVINEMILTSKVDIKTLQLKHTDVRRTLRSMASQEDLDIDAVIKNLTELKQKTAKRLKPGAVASETST